jgi:glycosyltransferase involved in cell wall biosynthesis
MTALRLAIVVAAAAAGTGLHAALLAEGCAARGLSVDAFGPAETGRRFFRGDRGGPAAPPGGDSAGTAHERGSVRFEPVEIADRPRPARDAAAVLRLRRLLAAAAPDVVHAHGMRAGAIAAVALMRARRPAPALIVTVHNAPPGGALANLVYLALERVIARRADAVLCASGDLAARMRRLGARDVAQAVVPAPAAAMPSAEAAGKARAAVGASGRPMVLAVGRLAEQKGFAVLLDAAAAWQDRQPAPLLVIAGEGPLAGELAARARRSGIVVTFLGRRDDVPALIAAADVMVVPSMWEARALVVQEALRAGTPLVASRVGGIPDLTGEDAALLVPPRDSGLLAAAVLSVLDDRALAARLRAAALARAGALPSESDAVDAAIAAYRRLAARRGRPR